MLHALWDFQPGCFHCAYGSQSSECCVHSRANALFPAITLKGACAAANFGKIGFSYGPPPGYVGLAKAPSEHVISGMPLDYAHLIFLIVSAPYDGGILSGSEFYSTSQLRVRDTLSATYMSSLENPCLIRRAATRFSNVGLQQLALYFQCLSRESQGNLRACKEPSCSQTQPVPCSGVGGSGGRGERGAHAHCADPGAVPGSGAADPRQHQQHAALPDESLPAQRFAGGRHPAQRGHQRSEGGRRHCHWDAR